MRSPDIEGCYVWILQFSKEFLSKNLFRTYFYCTVKRYCLQNERELDQEGSPMFGILVHNSQYRTGIVTIFESNFGYSLYRKFYPP